MTENWNQACGSPAAAASEHMSKKGSGSNLGNMYLLSAPKLVGMSIPAPSFSECFTEHSGVPGLVLFAGNRMLGALPHG